MRARLAGASWRIEPLPPPILDSPNAVRASGRARLLALSLLVAGGVVLAWGAAQADDKECGPGSELTYIDPEPLWLPWFAFVGIAGLLLAVWRTLARDVSWVKGWALAAMITSAIIFPVGVLFLLSAMNCSM